MSTFRFSLGRSSVVVLCVSILILSVARVFAFEVPPNDGYVTDAAEILTAEEEASLEAELGGFRTATSNEIAVVIIPSLNGETIEDIGLKIGRKWGIGAGENDNGILLLVSYAERAVRIEVGYGLEGAVPDLVAKGIIDTDILPAFRDGHYAGGIRAAVVALQKHIGNEYTADRYAGTQSGMFGPWFFFLLFIGFQWLLAILGRTKSWWLGGVMGGVSGLVLALVFAWWISIPLLVIFGLFLDFIVSKNYHRRGATRWWAGGSWGPGGGGGGGGGFGGFGGGSFGGGGASGRW